MKSFIVFALLVAAAVAAPPQYGDDKQAETLVNVNDNIGTGDYNAKLETSNGIVSETQGALKKVGTEDALTVRGSYSYPGTDGVVYTVNYYADETGFHAEGAHIPH